MAWPWDTEPDESPSNAAALPVPSGAGATLPTGTDQPDLARETTRGASMSGSAGLAEQAPGFFARVAGGDPKTLKGVAAMLFALSDAADRLSTGKPGSNKAQTFLDQQARLDLAQSAEERAKQGEARAERGDVRAQAAEEREAKLFPMREKLSEAQLRRMQLESGKDFLALYGTVDLESKTPAEQSAHRAAIRAEAQAIGINPLLTETVFTDRGFLSFLKPRVEAIREHLTPEDAGQLRMLMRTAKPGETSVAIEQAKTILQRAVERKASRSLDAFATALGHSPTQAELSTRFADDPTVLETISQSPVLAPWRERYGLTGTKAAAVREEKKAGEKTPAELEAEARARKAGELKAEAAFAPGAPSAVFKTLDNKTQAYLAGRGQTTPTSQQVEEARLAVESEGDATAMTRSIRMRAIADLNRREGTKQGKKVGKPDELFSNLPDGDVKLLAVGDENLMAGLLKNVLGGGTGAPSGPSGAALKNGKTRQQNIADLMTKGRTREKAEAEVNDLLKKGKL